MKIPGNIVTTCAAVAGSLSGMCPSPDAIQEGKRFHTDVSCDRHAQTTYKSQVNRNLKYRTLKEGGVGASAVPNQKTSHCPLNPQQFADSSSPATTGLDTIWIVENTASTPVVISYLNANGVEVSAKNPSIAPAEKDPDTILQPNQWLAINTFEGHVFSARELLADGTTGDVLLQHKVGLIPVGAHLAEHLHDCPDTDPEPLSVVEEEQVRDPAFQRTTPTPLRPCNMMDVGFRNAAGCPLHGYYVSVASNDSNDLTCTEAFKFHLGTDMTTADFMWDWASPTKYEGTFMGHTFSFRLAHDPSVLVERITLEPTRVTDCPNRPKRETVKSSSDRIGVRAEGQEDIHEEGENDGGDEILIEVQASGHLFVGGGGGVGSL